MGGDNVYSFASWAAHLVLPMPITSTSALADRPYLDHMRRPHSSHSSVDNGRNPDEHQVRHNANLDHIYVAHLIFVVLKVTSTQHQHRSPREFGAMKAHPCYVTDERTIYGRLFKIKKGTWRGEEVALKILSTKKAQSREKEVRMSMLLRRGHTLTLY